MADTPINWDDVGLPQTDPGNAPSGGTSANASNWFNSLASGAGSLANAYAAATGRKPAAPKTNYLPFILLGGVGLIVVLVLALRR